MAGLSRFVLHHKLVIALFWLAVLAAGVVASARLSGRLSGQFALPGGRTPYDCLRSRQPGASPCPTLSRPHF